MTESGYWDHMRILAGERERIRQLILAHEPLPMHRDSWDVPIEQGGGKYECMAEDWRGTNLRMHISHLIEVCGLARSDSTSEDHDDYSTQRQ